LSSALWPGVAFADPPRAPAHSGEPEFRRPADPVKSAEIDRLAALLGSPRFAEREEASTGLWEIGVPAFFRLREAYHSTHDFEVKARIEALVRDVYLDTQVSFGFLGIQQDTRMVPGPDVDPRIPPGHVGIILRDVFPDTGAARAGLQKGDIVLAVDGQRFSGDAMRAVDEFGAKIRERGPRGRLKLRILRGGREFDVTATLTRPKGVVVRQGRLGRVNIADALYQAEWQFEIWWKTQFLSSPATSAN
jgi:hypothetical protein